MSEELKPCPFCNGPVRRGSEENEKHENAFWCEKCWLEFTYLWHTHSRNYIDAWNDQQALAARDARIAEYKQAFEDEASHNTYLAGRVKELMHNLKEGFKEHKAELAAKDKRIEELEKENAMMKQLEKDRWDIKMFKRHY